MVAAGVGIGVVVGSLPVTGWHAVNRSTNNATTIQKIRKEGSLLQLDLSFSSAHGIEGCNRHLQHIQTGLAGSQVL